MRHYQHHHTEWLRYDSDGWLLSWWAGSPSQGVQTGRNGGGGQEAG